MKMVKILIQVPKPIKAKLDALRSQSYTASGFIRALLERELNHATQANGKRQSATDGVQ